MFVGKQLINIQVILNCEKWSLVEKDEGMWGKKILTNVCGPVIGRGV
jgi:hypothetical protein